MMRAFGIGRQATVTRGMGLLTGLLLLACDGGARDDAGDGARADSVARDTVPAADAAAASTPVTIDVYIREGAIAAGLDRAGLRARVGEPDSVVGFTVPNRHDPSITDSIVTLHYEGARYVFYRVSASGNDILDLAEIRSNDHLRLRTPGIGSPADSVRVWFGSHGLERGNEIEYDCDACEVPQPVTFVLDDAGRVRSIRFDYYLD